jgi:hypothetical protein
MLNSEQGPGRTDPFIAPIGENTFETKFGVKILKIDKLSISRFLP